MLKYSQGKIMPLQNITNNMHTRSNNKKTRNHPFTRNRRVNSMLDNYLAITRPIPSNSLKHKQPNGSNFDNLIREEGNNSISIELSVFDEEPIKKPLELRYREHQIDNTKKDMRKCLLLAIEKTIVIDGSRVSCNFNDVRKFLTSTKESREEVDKELVQAITSCNYTKLEYILNNKYIQ